RLIVETSGRACRGYEIRIWRTDDRDTEAAIGDVGEIGGRGASLMLGYFDDQRATEDAFNAHGWFMTGDLGWMDANGYLRVTGRKKDVIIRGGHNIHPARIEMLAMQYEAVERAAVIPVRDARLGEKVCLAVVFRDSRRADAAELLAHLDHAGLSRYEMPEYFLVLEHIPLTPRGKMRKRDLVEAIEQGRLTATPTRGQERQQASQCPRTRTGSRACAGKWNGRPIMPFCGPCRLRLKPERSSSGCPTARNSAGRPTSRAITAGSSR